MSSIYAFQCETAGRRGEWKYQKGQRQTERTRGRLNQSGTRDSREHELDERQGAKKEVRVDERTPLSPQFRATLRVTDEMQRYCCSVFEATALSARNKQYQSVEIKRGRTSEIEITSNQNTDVTEHQQLATTIKEQVCEDDEALTRSCKTITLN